MGIMSGSYQEAKFREDYPDVKTRSLVTTDDLINALMKGEVRAVIQEETIMDAALDRLGLQGDITSRSERLFPSTIHAGVLKDKTDLLQEIDKGLSLIPKSKLVEMESRWIHNPKDRYYQPGSKQVKLSTDEKAWLKAHPVIRVHNEMEWTPFNFFENGTPKGFSIDYMNLLASKLGIEVKYITGPTWNEFINMVKNNELDIMLNIARSPERETFLNFTHQPYVTLMLALYTRDDQPMISSIEDLYGKTFAIPKGFYLQEFLEKHPKIKIHEVSNTTEAIRAVATGKADFMFDLMPVVNYITGQLQVTNLKVGGDIDIAEGKPIPLHIGMRKEFAPLAGILEKTMKTVTDDELRGLREKWLGRSDKQQVKGKLQADFRHRPPEMIIEDGRLLGPLKEILEEAAGISGYTIEWRTAPFKVSLQGLRTGQVDIVPRTIRNNEREEFIDFLGPIKEQKKDILFIVPKGKEESIRVYEDLYNLSVGVKAKNCLLPKL